MYTILIADEKDYMRKGTKQKLLRMFDCVNIVGEASDGEEALDMIIRLKPDIVIIDSRLPGISGLDCIERIKQRGSASHFIIASEYDNFSYVQRALRLGVYDYLLKPVNNQAFKNALLIAMQAIDQEKAEKLMLVSERADKKMPFFKMNELWLEAMAAPSTDSESTRKLAEKCGETFRYKYFSVFAVRLIKYRDKTLEKDSGDLASCVICGMLAEMFREHASLQCFFTENSRCVYGIVNHSLPDAEFDMLLNKFVLSVQRDISLKCRVGVCGACTDFPSLSKLCEESRNILLHAISLSESNIIHCEDLVHLRDIDYIPDEDVLNGIIALLQSSQCDDGAFDEAVNAIMTDLTIKRCTYEAIRQACHNVISSIIHGFGENLCAQVDHAILQHFLEPFSGCETLEDFHREMTDRLADLRQYIVKINLSTGKKIVSKIKTRIRAEYNKNLKLNNLAADYFINQSYLSALFQQETGVSFSKYLADVRLQKAMELLASTSYSTGKIAEMVGYNDRNYFAAVFSKHVGLTPMQYRKALLDGSIKPVGGKDYAVSSDDTLIIE